MRKIALAFGFLLALQTVALAQGVRAGFQLSPTWSWMRTDDKSIEGVGTNWGLKVGFEFELPNLKQKDDLGLAFVTGIGLGLNQGGTLLNNHPQGVFWPKTILSTPVLDTLPQGARLTYHLSYLEFPANVRMRTPSLGRLGDTDMRLNIDGGLLFGLRVFRAVGDIRGTAPVQSEDEDIAEEVARFSIGWNLGASVEFETTGGLSFVTGVMYQQQLTDMTSDNGSVFDSRTNAWRKEDSVGAYNMLVLRLAIYL